MNTITKKDGTLKAHQEFRAIVQSELFEVAPEYEFGDLQKAIQHVSSPGKTGIVLLKSPV